MLYASDRDDDPDRATRESYNWAIEHGHKYRIAYACQKGDFEVPDGWDVHLQTFGSKGDRDRRDMIMFSPACIRPQRRLFS